jgi:uncharacterized integral membrane protein (TIGR00698 family)
MGLLSVGVSARAIFPGLLICGLVALSATFLSDHYGGPQLLYALLLGLALHSLFKQDSNQAGIQFCARTVLRLGVGLLGVRITLGQVSDLGIEVGLVLVAAVALTLVTGVLLARWLRRPMSEGLLSGGAVGICGASAALAIASVLPPTRDNERFTLLVVVGVTLLSTVAMVLYPFFLNTLALTPLASGVFLGGTIHDVAQVVAAGMMMGQETADAATVVKLFRVVLLLPVVLVISWACRHWAVNRTTTPSPLERPQVPLIPGFLLFFLALVMLASGGWLPDQAVSLATDTSRWCLVLAIAASGIKTSLGELEKLGWQPVLMLLTETVVIAALVLAAVLVFQIGQH